MIWLANTLPAGDSLPRQIANAHVAFNVLGVAVFIGFVPQIARLLRLVIPGEDRLTSDAEGATAREEYRTAVF